MSIAWVAAVLLAAAPAEKPKLVVLDLAGAGGAETAVVAAFTEAVTTAISARGVFDVISSRDVAALLGVERQKQLLGCGEEANSCMAELSGALGARFVTTGTLAKLGDAWQLTLTTLDSQTAKPVGRSIRIGAQLSVIQAQLPWAVSEATATPSPAPVSRVLPVGLVTVGAAIVLGGGVLGIQALSNEASLAAELGNERPGALDSRAQYVTRSQNPSMMKTVSLIMMGGGAVVAATGVLLLIRTRDSSASAALVPTLEGAALVGVFP